MGYEEFKVRYEQGEFEVGVSPADARQFFINTSRGAVEERLGIPLAGTYNVIKTLFYLHWLALFFSCVCLGLAAQWWSLLYIPLGFIVYLIRFSMASLRGQSLVPSFLFLIICAAGAYIWLTDFKWWMIFAIVYPFSFLLLKWTYRTATFQMRSLIIGNPTMYELVKENLLLKNNSTGVTFKGNELQSK
ncbi:hypothetical protein [Paenibacillus sp. MMO-58]|uniref:hypothetical protein n=1 Tax=Paenibacillus sp. MMO-58 TaxID=3081290 RepID=UPI0030186A14